MTPTRKVLALTLAFGAAMACASGGASTAAAPGGGAASSVTAPSAPRPKIFLGDTLPTCQYRETGEVRFTSSLRGPSLVRALVDSAEKRGSDGMIKVQGPTSFSTRGGGGGGRRGGGGGGGSGGAGGPADVVGTLIRFADQNCRR